MIFSSHLSSLEPSCTETRTYNSPMPQFYHRMKSVEEAKQNNLALLSLMFSVVLITFKIKTVALKSEAEKVCSVRRQKRQDYSFFSTLISNSKNYLLKGQKTHSFCFSCLISLILLCSPVLSVFFLFFFLPLFQLYSQ